MWNVQFPTLRAQSSRHKYQNLEAGTSQAFIYLEWQKRMACSNSGCVGLPQHEDTAVLLPLYSTRRRYNYLSRTDRQPLKSPNGRDVSNLATAAYGFCPESVELTSKYRSLVTSWPFGDSSPGYHTNSYHRVLSAVLMREQSYQPSNNLYAIL